MTPGEFIRDELKRRGWGQDDLARILDRSASSINELIQGRAAITPKLAVALAAVLGGTPDEWLQREGTYRLSLENVDLDDLRRRARLFEIAPVKEMQKRGWIARTDDATELEKELKRFYDVSDLSVDPPIVPMFKKSASYSELTPAQRAWCARARQMAKALVVPPFNRDGLAKCESDLRRLAAFPEEARKVPSVLAKCGIRFVVVEPLQGCKIDGATIWLDKDSPIIAMSLRYDRNDAFWFTLGHEFWHVRNEDGVSVDADLNGPDARGSEVDPVEARANQEATALLIEPDKLKSFILRVAPMYSKTRINQFANVVKIHPGIIVGQLQHRGEIGYQANREMLEKIRDIVTATATTDGWGCTIDPRIFA